jgi:hypothetical protein
MSKLAMLGVVAVMVCVIVGTDLLFFRHNFWGRLTANVVIVIAFAVIYVCFLKRP